MSKKRICGIIGITDEGQPIVTPNYQCSNFNGEDSSLTMIKECWYCKYADFRKSCDIMLQQSICRCPKNRLAVMEICKNEQELPPDK